MAGNHEVKSARPANSGTAEQSRANSRTKRAYQRPTLVCYGTVKQLTNSVTGVGGDLLGRMMMSERAAKENIVRIGEHPLGFGLYLFEYKAEFASQYGFGRHFGVMADEVERVFPAAVSRDINSYRVVDYAKIGGAVEGRSLRVAHDGSEGQLDARSDRLRRRAIRTDERIANEARI